MNITQGLPYINQIKDLIIEYTQSLHRDLSFQGLEEELDHLENKYAYGQGVLLAAINNDQEVIGCVAYHRLSEKCCEMKRLYVKPNYRQMHIGDKLVETLIEQAKEDGYQEMVLDTIKPLQTAIHLYQKHGFMMTEAYYYNPMDDVIYMKKVL